jgi:hypothetical protein
MMGSSATSDVADLSYFISHVVSLYQTVLRAGIFDIHGVLSINVDRKKKGCFDPFPLALLLSYIIFCLTLLYSLLFYSVLRCHFLSRVASCCMDCIALFLRFTVPYSMPFYAMRHCDVTLCYTAQCTLHSFLHLLCSEALPYYSVLVYPLKYNNIHQIYHAPWCVRNPSTFYSISRATLLCSLSLHFCHSQVTK